MARRIFIDGEPFTLTKKSVEGLPPDVFTEVRVKAAAQLILAVETANRAIKKFATDPTEANARRAIQSASRLSNCHLEPSLLGADGRLGRELSTPKESEQG